MKKVPSLGLLLLAAATLLAAGCGPELSVTPPPTSVPPPASGPAKLFEDAKRLAENGNMAGVFELIHPDEQNITLLSTTMLLSFKPEHQEALTGIYTEHQVTDPKTISPDGNYQTHFDGALALANKAFEKVADRKALLTELLALGGPEMKLPVKFLGHTLKDLELDGNRATGIVVNQAGEWPAVFVKTDGEWRFSLNAAVPPEAD